MNISREKILFIFITTLLSVGGFLLMQSYPTRTEVNQLAMRINTIEASQQHIPKQSEVFGVSERLARIEETLKQIKEEMRELRNRDRTDG